MKLLPVVAVAILAGCGSTPKPQQTSQFCYTNQTIETVNKEDVTPYRVTMQCQNQRCCNPHHFEIKETNRPDKLV